MTRLRIRTVCVALALLASTAPSRAETVIETATRWGLLGTWRVNCNAPPYFFDPAETYVVRVTLLLIEQDAGSGKNADVVSAAVIQDGGRVELTIDDPAGRKRRKNVLERNAEGRIRLLTSWDDDTGTFYVRNARMANGLRGFDWQQRCG